MTPEAILREPVDFMKQVLIQTLGLVSKYRFLARLHLPLDEHLSLCEQKQNHKYSATVNFLMQPADKLD